MLTLKASSPEKRWLEMADGFSHPAGNSLWCVIGKHQRPPRDRRPRRVLHGDYAVTREIRTSAHGRCAPSDKC